MPRELASHSPAVPIRLAISWLTNALVLGIVAAVLSQVTVRNAGALLEAAAVFGVLNTLLKPLLLGAGGGNADRLGRESPPRLRAGPVAGHRQAPPSAAAAGPGRPLTEG